MGYGHLGYQWFYHISFSVGHKTVIVIKGAADVHELLVGHLVVHYPFKTSSGYHLAALVELFPVIGT